MLQNIVELERRSGIKLGLAQKTLLAETGTTEQVLSILTGAAVRVNIVEQRENKKIFVYNLPRKVACQIRQKQLGIGTIIANSSLETFRKITEVGYDPLNRWVFRRYRIIYRKKVAFEIMEELIGI